VASTPTRKKGIAENTVKGVVSAVKLLMINIHLAKTQFIAFLVAWWLGGLVASSQRPGDRDS
jgi:hypothetical protein